MVLHTILSQMKESILRQRRCDNGPMTLGYTSSTPYPFTRRRGHERIMAEPTENSPKEPAWDTLLGHCSPGINVYTESKASIQCCVSTARLHGSRSHVEAEVVLLILTFPSIIYISCPEKVSYAKLEFLFLIGGGESREVENIPTKWHSKNPLTWRAMNVTAWPPWAP